MAAEQNNDNYRPLLPRLFLLNVACHGYLVQVQPNRKGESLEKNQNISITLFQSI